MTDSRTDPFLTKKEIESQPEVWRAAATELRARSADPPVLGDFSQVIFTGCGSTAYLAQWAAAHCRDLHTVPALAVPASELIFHPDAWVTGQRTLLVAISRSAKTTETVRAVEEFRARKLGHVAVVTCEPGHELSRSADWLYAVPSAAERAVPQTRSFTSMMLAVSALLTGSSDGVVDQLASHARQQLSDYPDGLTDVSRPDLAYTFLGTGPRVGLAHEAMLKVKEMSLAPAEAFQTLEFRHGPMSTTGPHSVVVALIGDRSAKLELAVLDDLAELGASTVAVGPANDAITASRHRHLTFDAGLAPPWRDVLYLPVMQQTAVTSAVVRGRDPDNPTNLKAVVVLDE